MIARELRSRRRRRPLPLEDRRTFGDDGLVGLGDESMSSGASQITKSPVSSRPASVPMASTSMARQSAGSRKRTHTSMGIPENDQKEQLQMAKLELQKLCVVVCSVMCCLLLHNVPTLHTHYTSLLYYVQYTCV